jgi:hypothetical protein
MIASHIHDALGQIDRMRDLILERRRFRGFSGTARMLGGALALAAALVLDRADLLTPGRQLAGWAVVLAAALLLNFGGLALWFLRRRRFSDHPLADLRPALDVTPALAVGAALSLALVLRGQHDLLFGTWMSLYGLAHMGYRHSLPGGIIAVGLFYQVAGVACLLIPDLSFLNPWPMGLVFFAGETIAGWLLRSGPAGEPAIQNPITDEEPAHESAT